ncbi:MAG: sugar isomerase [Lewinellaceae bacterium]|nr:sugar isomerase [Phaeodactylibacter sp.]MCB9040633.1 sugar isomerase [Lewinellaceae bacterium]
MKIEASQIADHNKRFLESHRESFVFLSQQLGRKARNADEVVEQLKTLQIAIPSWALGAGGTRFGRFSMGGEPGSLEQKINDIGLIHALTGSAGAVSLHIPWDIPKDVQAVKELAAARGIAFDAVNSNTFQDQPGQEHSYKFGSLCHADPAVREQAIQHNLEVIETGKSLGSKSITVWLADGASFPGQNNLRRALQHTMDSLKTIYRHLPGDWKMYIEYKPYEPNFYSTVIQDWGTSYLLATECGGQAYTLVDLGHHLPNTNIEQIVATLMMKGKLGGFHFNDSKYGDDDLTVGSIKPYQLFLIFNELVYGMNNNTAGNPPLAWMIDASHNVKDPLEDLIQSLEAIRLAYAQALLVDSNALAAAQNDNDVTRAQEILQDAFRTDLRPLLREARLQSGAALEPLAVYRSLEVRKKLVRERGKRTVATGL